jgi:hypothetical protein
MKKLMLGITILALIVIASSAMAQTAKVPKVLCFSFSSNYDHELVLKSMGSISALNGKVKIYSVTGHGYAGAHGPIHGSGYVAPSTTIFHATYTKMTPAYIISTFQLSFNLASNTGSLKCKYEYADGSIMTADYPVTGTSCSDLPISIPESMAISPEAPEGNN